MPPIKPVASGRRGEAEERKEEAAEAPPAPQANGGGNDDQPVEVVGDTHLITMLAVLFLAGWLKTYLDPCTC